LYFLVSASLSAVLRIFEEYYQSNQSKISTLQEQKDKMRNAMLAGTPVGTIVLSLISQEITPNFVVNRSPLL